MGSQSHLTHTFIPPQVQIPPLRNFLSPMHPTSVNSNTAEKNTPSTGNTSGSIPSKKYKFESEVVENTSKPVMMYQCAYCPFWTLKEVDLVQHHSAAHPEVIEHV